VGQKHEIDERETGMSDRSDKVRHPMAGSDFVVALRPTARCVAPVVALRLLLKTALRVHGLRCVGITTTPEPGPLGD
jgi:hypothetical protein